MGTSVLLRRRAINPKQTASAPKAPSGRDKELARELIARRVGARAGVATGVKSDAIYMSDPRGSFPSRLDIETGRADFRYVESASNFVPFVANDGSLATTQRSNDEVVTANERVDGHVVEISDVRQGVIRDCYFLAALAAVADLNPDYVEKMIEVDEDTQRWIVKLRDIDGRMVAVSVDMTLPFHDNSNARRGPAHGSFAHSDDSAAIDERRVYEIWPTIMEKAYAALRSAELGQDLNYSAIEESSGGAKHALQALTGFGDFVKIPDTVEGVIDLLRDWFPSAPSADEGGLGAGSRRPIRPILVMTDEDAGGDLPADHRPATGNVDVIPDHAYVVRRAMIDADSSSAWITLHNPWGRKHLVKLPISALLVEAPELPGVRMFRRFAVGASP